MRTFNIALRSWLVNLKKYSFVSVAKLVSREYLLLCNISYLQLSSALQSTPYIKDSWIKSKHIYALHQK